MKSLLIFSSLFLSFYSFAQDTYTFDCASDQGYIVVRIDSRNFNSQLKQVQGELEIHSDNGTEEFSNAFFSNRSLNHNTGVFRFSVGMDRNGSAVMRGNYLEQKGSFSVKTAKNNFNSLDAVCRLEE